jgi:hypothetical protein
VNFSHIPKFEILGCDTSFITIPLAINCSNIICHSTSIPVEGEYRPSLKDCLIKSESSSEAPHLYIYQNLIRHHCRGPSTVTFNNSRAQSPLYAGTPRSLSAPLPLIGRRRQGKRRCPRPNNNSLSHGPLCFSLQRKIK